MCVCCDVLCTCVCVRARVSVDVCWRLLAFARAHVCSFVQGAEQAVPAALAAMDLVGTHMYYLSAYL